MNDTPNVVAGTVTNRRDHVPARVTARKIVRYVVAAFLAFLAFGFILQATGHGDSKSAPKEEVTVTCDSPQQVDCYDDFTDRERPNVAPVNWSGPDGPGLDACVYPDGHGQTNCLWDARKHNNTGKFGTRSYIAIDEYRYIILRSINGSPR